MNHTFHNMSNRNSNSVDISKPSYERGKIVRPQIREGEMKETTQLICPSCLNKSVSKDFNRNLKSKAAMVMKEDTSIKDFFKQANEDLIRVRIANREQRTYDASQSLAIFKDATKAKFQQLNESQNQSGFFNTTDHTLERAKRKNSQLEKLIKNHLDKFTPKEKMEMKKYYEKYVNQTMSSISLNKSMSCPPSVKKNYSNALQSQIDQRKQLNDAKREEKTKDRLTMESSMNQSGKQLKCKRAINKDKEKQCVEQNDRIIVMKNKKLNEQKEMNSKMDQEHLNNNQRLMSDFNKQLINKRDQLNNILVYNMKMDNIRHQKSEEEKKNDLLYKNKGYLRELLCQHGCEVYKCAICLRLYPRRVLTPVVVRTKK